MKKATRRWPFLSAEGSGRGRRAFRQSVAVSSIACWIARRRRSSAWRVKYQAKKVNSETLSRIRLATALISGFTPRRTAENTSIGKVVEPGPETKLASTRSSSDRAKDIMPPAASEGAIIGMVISRNTFQGLAPRSIAASSIDRSSSRRRADTTTAT